MPQKNAGLIVVIPIWLILIFNYFLLGDSMMSGIFLYVLLPIAMYLTVLFLVVPLFTKKEIPLAYQYGNTYGFRIGIVHLLICVTLAYGGITLFFYQNNIFPFEMVKPKLLKNYLSTVGAMIVISQVMKFLTRKQ